MNKTINSAFAFEGNTIRVLGTPDAPLFVAADACRILGLGNVSQAVNGNAAAGALGLDDDQKGKCNLDTLGGSQTVTVVTEPGLYALIFKSRKPEAKTFQDWVLHEVLPAIRKTGTYSIPGHQMPKTFADALLLAGTLEKEREQAIAAQKKTQAALDIVTKAVVKEKRTSRLLALLSPKNEQEDGNER